MRLSKAILSIKTKNFPISSGDKSPELIGKFFVLKVITLLSLTVFGVMIYETWHPCYSDDTQPPGLSCRIFGAYLPFSINRINLHILSAQRCALFSSPKSSYSGVLPDMLSSIKKVRPRKTGISNLRHDGYVVHLPLGVSAANISAETSNGGVMIYPAERNKLHSCSLGDRENTSVILIE